MSKFEATATAELKAPKQIDKNLGKAMVSLADGAKSLACLPEKMLDIVKNSSATLFSPLSAHLHGVAAKIEYNNLRYTDATQQRKEISQMHLATNVLENFSNRLEQGKEIPEIIEDTDTLFAIQNTASEYTDKQFLEFWAELYTQEALKPNTVSKKTIELCKTLDKEIIDILINDIFPYCSSTGLFLGINRATEDYKVNNVSKAFDYGFINKGDLVHHSSEPQFPYQLIFGDYNAFIHTGYQISTLHPGFDLTVSGIEIKKCLSLLSSKEHISDIIDELKHIMMHKSKLINNSNYQTKLKPNASKTTPKFIFTEGKKIICPLNWQNKTIQDYCTECLANIELIKKKA